MDVIQLRAFVEIARLGSFSRAALALGLTQPAVSRQLKQLEEELGLTLVDREQRPVAVTPTGKDFLSCAETVVKQLEAAIQRLSTTHATLAGSVAIAASTIPGEFLVPGILARFSARFPRVSHSLLIADSARVAEELLGQRAEVGFLGAAISQPRLHLIPLVEDEIVLVVPADHPFARKRVIVLSDLEGQPFVERGEGSGTLGSLRRILAQHGLSLPQHTVAWLAGTSQIQLAAIEAGAGLGFLSSLALANRLDTRVIGVEIEGIKLKRTLYLAYLNQPLTPAAQALVDFVKESQEVDGLE